MRFAMKLMVSAFLGVSLLSGAAHAASLTINNAALQQVSSDIAYGGCYATLSVPVGSTCTGSIVSFDCDGKFNVNGAGNRHYSTALLAFSLNKPVSLIVETTKRYTGYCVATRVSIVK
ncbi:MAG: hypothetical protein RI964_3121 [Pseudomonadota bacterium]|jgi:hypothetical protein